MIEREIENVIGNDHFGYRREKEGGMQMRC
jgi:hypothetical protein